MQAKVRERGLELRPGLNAGPVCVGSPTEAAYVDYGSV